MKLGLVARNVAKLVPSKPTKPDTPEGVLQNCWTAEEARRFLASLQDESLQVQAFYTLALETGMRKGELAGLKWTDIDFEAGTVTVARTLLKPGRDPVFGPPKNGLPRTIALSKATLRLLKRHRAQQNQRKLANRDQYRDHGLVFAKDWEDMKRETNSLGDPLQINNIAERQFDPLQEKAGVRRINVSLDTLDRAAFARLAHARHAVAAALADRLGDDGRIALLLHHAGHAADRAGGHVAQGRHMAGQILGEAAQFVGQHPEAQGRVAGPLGEEDGVQRHQIDAEGRRDDGLDFFIDADNAGQFAAAAKGSFQISFRRVHTGLSGGGLPHWGALIGAGAAAALIQKE